MEENKNIENEVVDGASTSAENEGQQKTYTEEEVLRLLQSEGDRRVSQALEKQKKKYEKEISLSKLDEDARANAEKDMKIQELQEQLKEFTVMQNKNEVVKVLTARGLNPAFAELVEIGEDSTEALAKIDQLDKLFKASVQEEVKKKLSSGVPNIGNSTESSAITKEQFKKMTLAQQSQLYRENPELYKELSKH